ncbi:glycosyltransferase, partial [Arthrospira platensis SPKY1]|nr:glycosyltransferase [Arthrospira platensis SPKY1]
LLVAGEFYTQRDAYDALLSHPDLQGRVHLYDRFIPDQEVNRYFCAADLIVQPYKHATQSGVTQIAYHFEKPMLVTEVGGLAEIVPHGKAGYVCEASVASIQSSLED